VTGQRLKDITGADKASDNREDFQIARDDGADASVVIDQENSFFRAAEVSASDPSRFPGSTFRSTQAK